MRSMLREIFPKRYFIALAVGGVAAAAGAVVMELADLPDAWSLVILVVAIVVSSLTWREGFYGAPHSRP